MLNRSLQILGNTAFAFFMAAWFFASILMAAGILDVHIITGL